VLPQANGRGRAGLDYRALVAVILCAALPVLIGILVATRDAPSEPAVKATGGHWVYVSGQGVAVHVNGTTKLIDATVHVGAASAGSPVLADHAANYLVDDDRVVLFGHDGVTGDAPAPGIAEQPVPVEAGGTAYLVYRTAGLIVRLAPEPVRVSAGGPLGAPVVSPSGQLWTYRMDSGDLCVLVEDNLSCPSQIPTDHTGALSVLNGKPGFVDVTASTWQELSERGADKPVELDLALPANAAVGPVAVGDRLAIVDPTQRRLLLVPLRGKSISVPLGDSGTFGAPTSTGAAVGVVDTDTGTITTFDRNGRQRAELTLPGGGIGLITGADGRAYADATDGLQSAVMDADGTLTLVRTTDGPAPTYESAEAAPSVSLPPATVAVTTTETIPPVPETVTVEVTPSTNAPGGTGAPPGTTGTTPAGNPPATSTRPAPGPPAGSPTVDVVSASASGPGQATIEITVTGEGPVYCHVYFNSVERAATRCEGTMTIVANGLAPGLHYDIYVLGTNAKGTGGPGKRGNVQL
jgi:hypothetical protein